MKKSKFFIASLAALVLGVTGLAGCSPTTTDPTTGPTSEPTSQPDPTTPAPSEPAVVHVESVTVTSTLLDLRVGDTSQVSVEVLPADATDKTYTLTSSSDEVVTVDTTGLVTAVGIGTADVIATATDGGITGKVTFNVERALVHPESITLASTVSELYVGQTTTVSVEVLPENAETEEKGYVLTSSDDAVATVTDTGVVEAVAPGSVTITATSTYNEELVDSVDLTVLELTAPTLNLPETTTYSVNVGEELVLPEVTAVDCLGNDLTEYVEVEDISGERGTIKDGKFKAYVAGEHILSYYVADLTNDELYAEGEIVVNVVPTTESTFDTTGYEDIAAFGKYGTYKVDFEDGLRGDFYRAMTDANNAVTLAADSRAISGNSLIIDANKTSGSQARTIFFNLFSDYFVRDTAVTYSWSFDYKVLSALDAENPNNLNDFYVQLAWDGFDGLNQTFVNAYKDEVKTVTMTFPGAKVPATGNAWFGFFKLGGSDRDAIIAVDNFTFTAKEIPQVTPVIPTSDELYQENGFTWDMTDNGATFVNGEPVIVNNLDETLKTEMAASEYFHKNAVHLTKADSHNFSGLTKDNMVAGDELTIEVYYYAVNKGGICLIMMGAGNPTLKATDTHISGNIYCLSVTLKVISGFTDLNVYGAGNPGFDIYVGEIRAKLTEAAPIPVGQTPGGKTLGYSFEKYGRDTGFGLGTLGSGAVVTAYNPETDLADATAGAMMGDAPQKFVFDKGNQNVELFRASNAIEVEQTYRFTLGLHVVEWNGGKLHFNLDNSTFIELGVPTLGYQEILIEWTATTTPDFFCLLATEVEKSVGTFYLGKLTVELIGIAGFDAKTPGGYSRGFSFSNNSRQWGGCDEANRAVLAYDGNTNAVANEAMGTAPTKLVFKQGNTTIEWFQANNRIEIGQEYLIELDYYVDSWGDGRFMYNWDNQTFIDIGPVTQGYHHSAVRVIANRTVDFFSFFAPDTGSVGTIYVNAVTVTLTKVILG